MQSAVSATATATASMVGSWSMSTSVSATAVVVTGTMTRVVELAGEADMVFLPTATLQLQIPVAEPSYPVKKLRRVSPVFTVSPDE